MVLTLNWPEVPNVLNYALLDELIDRLNALERDDSVRCLVLTGQGDKAFSAGAEIARFALDIAASPESAWRNFVMRGQAIRWRIENYPKPIIVAVNGIAYGGGYEAMEACVVCQTRNSSWLSAKLWWHAAAAAPHQPQAHQRNDPYRRGRNVVDRLINCVAPTSNLPTGCLRMVNLIAANSAVTVTASLPSWRSGHHCSSIVETSFLYPALLAH